MTTLPNQISLMIIIFTTMTYQRSVSFFESDSQLLFYLINLSNKIKYNSFQEYYCLEN
jgi:hypothetical protein